ncbi:hypothetical protein DLH72_00995 [Candidatus Gracilibacteria bacterium]|nr:MAG: hypothetical protein DLH72_00995 [Candidatus Gracilibacteria bacterium]
MNLLKKLLKENPGLRAEISRVESMDVRVIDRASEGKKVNHSNAFKIYAFLVDRNFFAIENVKLPDLFSETEETKNIT